MLKQPLTIVACLVGSVFFGILIAFLINSRDNIAIEKKLREDVKADVEKTLILFDKWSPRNSSSVEKSFISTYIKTVMSDKVNVYEYDPGGRPKNEDEDFLFTLNGRGYKLDVYLQKKFMETTFTFLDFPAYVGIAATIIAFTFAVYLIENKKKTRLMKQEFAEKHAKLSSALQQQEAMALLGRMTATLAHELKTPIATISNLVQVLPSRNTDKQFIKRFIELVGQEVTRTRQLIDNLLAYGKHIVIDKNEWIPIREVLINSSPPGITVDALTTLMIHGDKFYLELLFKNLLKNSQEAGATRVEINVETDTETPGSASKVICEDNGAGFSETADLEKLTDPFVTSRSRGGGLGLYLAQEIAAAHGGSLSLERVEKGARVIITFPAKRIRT